DPAVVEEGSTQQQQRKKKNKKKKWIWIGVILFLLLTSAVVALFVLPGMLQPKDVRIPDILEMHEDEAVEELEFLQLEVETEYVYSEYIEESHVIDTDTKVGRTVKEGSTVALIISDGKEKLEFENYVGYDFNQV